MGHVVVFSRAVRGAVLRWRSGGRVAYAWTRILQSFFEQQYEQQVQLLEVGCNRLYAEKSGQLRDECHFELVRAEAHVASEHHEAAAKLAVAEARIAVVKAAEKDEAKKEKTKTAKTQNEEAVTNPDSMAD